MSRSILVAVAAALAMVPMAVSAQSGNAARGERLFNQQCKACHSVEKNGSTSVGPNLHGLFGRKAGETEGFESSDAIRKSGIVWDDATLAEYLRDPAGRVPDTRMVYPGMRQQAQLGDVIAYLRKATQ
ncbi:MAG: cytochrome c family protein [Enhydrobacter sp.]|nr:MAG: cytochrome c family protein [Enhydrobacter sp.]